MDVPQLSPQLIDALRTWFHPKDRSVYLAPSTFAYLPGGIGYLSMAFISEVALTADATSATFSNIPQNFRTLILTTSLRTDRVAENDNMAIRFNNDSSAIYDYQAVYGNSVTAAAIAGRAGTSLLVAGAESANSRANCFGPSVIFVFNYSRSDVEKHVLAMHSFFGDLSADTDLFIVARAGGWRNKNVITSIVMLPVGGTNFVSGSRFQLYGVL